MRIGISALALDGATVQSGIARYCHQLIDRLVSLETGHRFEVYHGRDFAVPPSWRSCADLQLQAASGPLARQKTLWEVFGAAPRARAPVDVWLGTAHALPFSTSLPTALVVHDLFTFSHPELYTRKHRAVVGWSQRRAIGQANRLIAVSDHTRGELLRRFGVAPERAITVRLAAGNSAEPRERESVSDAELSSLGLPSTERGVAPFLLTLGTLEPRKNLPRLIEAFARLGRLELQRRLELVVVGAPGWMHSPIFDSVREHGVEDRVHFLGKVPDQAMPALFARCEAFVLPSLVEGFGLPVLEAMRSGALVACSDRGSLPEIAGNAAALFDPGSAEEIAATLAELLSTPGDRARRLEAGRIQAARFDWDNTARRTVEILEQLAPGGDR